MGRVRLKATCKDCIHADYGREVAATIDVVVLAGVDIGIDFQNRSYLSKER